MIALSNILRGIGGEFEIGRVLLTGASVAAIVSPIVFQAWEIHNGGHFDVTAWCVAYPGGLVALVAGGVLGIGSKDKSVAAAKQATPTEPVP